MAPISPALERCDRALRPPVVGGCGCAQETHHYGLGVQIKVSGESGIGQFWPSNLRDGQG